MPSRRRNVKVDFSAFSPAGSAPETQGKSSPARDRNERVSFVLAVSCGQYAIQLPYPLAVNE